MGKNHTASSNQQPSEIMVNFENMVKNCQVELVEFASCVIDQVKKQEVRQPNDFRAQIKDGYGGTYNNVQDQQIVVVEKIQSIEICGEVRVKAMVPGDKPKVQVKLALPDDYDQFSVHPLTIR